MIEQLIKNGIKIMNLEGAWLELNNKGDELFFEFDTNKDKSYINRDGEVITIKTDKEKIYSATMPYSLETIRAFEKYPKELLNERMKVAKEGDKKIYTKLFINFKFNKKYFDDGVDEEDTEGEERTRQDIDKKTLRKMIYSSKVIIDGEEYSFFKRGASKARTANVIFCKTKYCKKLYKRSLLGLDFKEDELCDLTSKEAYTSLIMSGIMGTIKIERDEILIINDIDSPKFKAKQTITIQGEDNVVRQEEGIYEVSNCITDGQGLMDESIFSSNELIYHNTTALLRNDFLKCNTCRTRLQEYWKTNNITQVWDMYKGWVDSSKIKLVITPNSCKFLKFADKCGGEKKCYLQWLNNIDNVFGVVKTDHMGNYGYSNRLSYQMINSMNFSKEEIRELMQDELDYLKLMKDNTLETNDTLKVLSTKKRKENREVRNRMDYFLFNLGTSDELSSGDMINALLNRNKDYRLTYDFKTYKKNQLKDYMNTLRLGKIRIKNSLYAIMVACPYEMLLATTKENNIIDSCIMKGYEMYCPNFEDGVELMVIRNPQINEGNIGSFTNRYREEYKWFGYWEDGKPKFDFAVFVNGYDCDLMNRLQGADFDSDTVFLTDNKLLVNKAKGSQSWATPTNGIKGKKDLKRYNMESLAELDNYLGGSTMSIGKIVNKSAIFNAYMYDGMNTGKNESYINNCFNASSVLSSCSQIAIDMAKKSFLDSKGKPLSLNSIMNSLNSTTYINDNGEEEKILRYDYDMENTTEITLKDYIQDEIGEEKGNKRKYKSVHSIEYDREDFESNKEDKEYEEKVLVHELKMIVPYFFKYTAQDNAYRIPTYMNCGMDYLEQILDEWDMKAMATDKIELKDLIVSQKSLKSRPNMDKINRVRIIVNDCYNTLSRNYYNNNDDEKEGKRKSLLRKQAKRKAICLLQDEKLNPATIHRTILRMFDLEKDYEEEKMILTNKKGEPIYYEDKKTNKKLPLYIKELKDLKSLGMTLLYNAYPNTVLECFIENPLEEIELERFWD